MQLKNYSELCLCFRKLLIVWAKQKRIKTRQMVNWKVRFILERIAKESISDILEIGTCVGITALTLAFGMMLLERKFKIYSIDIRDQGQFMLLNLFPELQKYVEFSIYEDSKTIKFLETHQQIELDLLIIDGSHKKEYIKKDFEVFNFSVRQGGLIVFDDIKMCKGANEYVSSLGALPITDPENRKEENNTLAYMRM